MKTQRIVAMKVMGSLRIMNSLFTNLITMPMLAAAVFMAVLPLSKAWANETVAVAVGEDTTLNLPEMAKSVDIESSKVVRVTKGDTKAILFVKGLQIGGTTMRVKLMSGKEVKYDIVVGNRAGQVLKLVSGIDGLKASERDGKIFIDGVVTTKEGAAKLNEAKRNNPGMIVDAAERNFAPNNAIVNAINRSLREHDMGNIQANAYGKMIVLEGSAANEQQAELASRIAQTMYPSIELRIAKDSNGAASVAIEVLFVEVDKSNDLKVGVANTIGGTGALDPKSESIAQAGITPHVGSGKLGAFGLNWQVGGLGTFLKLIQERATSRVLSNPKLVARSGTQARFHAGKTILLTETKKNKDGDTETTIFPYDSGIILEITPKLDPLGQIDAHVSTEVSEFGEIKKDTFPTITRSKVATAVTIRDGQTIMLSGLTRKTNKKTVSRVPILADIPIIGELFKSRQATDDEGEMLVLVTINRMQSQDDQQRAAGEKLFDQAKGDVEFSIFD